MIVKDGERSQKVHEDGKLHIDWKLTANQGHREFNELKVTDVLPTGVDHDNVKNIIIGGAKYELNGSEKNGIKVVKGWVSGVQGVDGDNFYNFSEDKDAVNNPRAAIQFVIGESHSTKEVKISFETIHEWNQDNDLDRIDYHTNYVGAATEQGLYQYTNKTVAIDQELQRGGKKGAKLHLDDKLVDPAKGNNYITWSIDFGGRLNDYFGKGDNQIDTIKITDKLNENGPKYLSYPEDKNDYTLYYLDSNRGNPQVVPRDQYNINWPPSSDGRGHREFTITFNDKAENKNYTNLRLEFNTRIYFDAWREVKPTPDTIPDPYTFLNTADVEYGDRKLEGLKNKVEVSSKGLDGQKTVEAGEGNALNWEILFNTRSKNIGQPTITDTLSPNQRHSINGIELAFVTPKFELNPNGTGYVVKVDKSKPQDVLEAGKDYSIHVDGNQKLTIQLKTNVERPLVIRYSTIMENSNGPYTNHAEIDARGHSTTYTTEHKLSGNAIMNVWPLRLLKVNGADNDKPLPGTTFRLEQRKLNSNDSWQPASRVDTGKDYGEIVSDENGLIEFEGLGTNLEYQLVEVSPSDEILSQMEPLQFNQKQATDAGWMKETHKIKNYPVTPGNLTLSKATKNLDNGRSFNFEVRTVDEQGNVNTGLQGTYKLQEGGEVTFHNGVSEEVSVPANKERTILGLPTEKVDASGNKSTQHYDVRETSTSDEYKTQVAVGNDDPIWSKQTKPFELSTSTATPVMIFFTNTAAKGDLVVSKTVSSKTEDEMDAKYDFTIQAQNQEDIDKVGGKTYEVEGAGLDELKFDGAGKATFSLKHTQQLKVMGLPEGVELTVTEEKVDMTTTWSINGADYTSTSGSVTINPDKAQTYDFKNSTEKSGQLQITKQIAGAIPVDETFKFEVRADKSVDGKYPYETYTVSNQHPGQAGMVEFKDGELTTPLSLTGDEYVKITNLPLNKEFAVKEVDPNDKDIQTTWQIGTSKEAGRDADPITLRNENDIASVTFTNQLPNGSLTLDKNVVGLPGDEATKFEFTIQASDENSINKVKNKTFTDAYNVVHEVDFDKDGKANISLRDSQRVKIIGLPAGINLRISEANNPDFNASYKVDGESADEEDADGPTVAIKDDGNTAVSYTNTRTIKGELIVSKTVSSTDKGELDAKYHFTVQADPADEVANKTFDTDGAGLDELKFDSEGQAEVDLKDGQRLKISGLPVGVEFKVTETTPETDMDTTWSINGGDYTNNDKSVTINGQKPQTVDFKNSSHPTGQLQVTKQITGDISADDVFKFEIETDSSVNGKYPYETYTVSNQHPGTAGTMEFKDGEATLSLKGDEYVRIKNLPLNKEFAVRELAPDNSDIKTTWQIGTTKGDGRDADPITLKDENDIANVTFTNALQNGSLTLTKRVLGAPQDPETAFEFTIEANEDSLEKVKGKTFQVDADFMDEISFNDEGQATLKLRDTQRVMILGLPGGITLRISEKSNPDYNVSYTVGNGEEEDDEAGPAITVQKGKNTTVNFTNTVIEKGDLMLEKRAEGSYPTDKAIGFTISALDENEALDGNYDATLTQTDGTIVQRRVSFENGKLSVSIKPSEKLQVKNLPTGQYQVKEDDQDASVTTTWDIGEVQGDNELADPITVEDKDTAHVLFTNKIATGRLELNKSVASHDDSDKNKEFKFEIRASDKDKDKVANESYAISGYAGTQRIKFNEDGIATVTLKDGQTATISGLPAGIEFKVVETDTHDLNASWNVNNQNGYENVTDENYPEVTITEDQTEVVSYRNVRDPVGSLRVDKVVKGAYTDDHRKFEFTVDAQTIKENENEDNDEEWIAHEGFNGEYEVKIYNSSNNELQETTQVEFKDGQATLELKAGQYAVINNLPLNDNERFQVSEVDPDIANMSTTWAVNNGTPAEGLEATPVTLNEKDVPRVTFTNSLETGNLVLEKKLSGEITDADRNQTFEFTVDAQVEDKDNQGEWLTDETFAGDYTATKTTADGRQTTSSVTFTDGQLTVSLKGGERLQISNLPANMRMIISETPDGDYETSHQIDHGSVTPGTTTDQITIPNGGDQAVTFINDRPAQPQTAWLSITKSVLGENGERDRGFEFSIRFLDDEMNPLTGTIGYVKTSPIGGYTPGQMMLDADGNGTFTLMDGETIRWQVPNGTHYQITESDYSADGYQTSISQGQAPEREGLTATGVLMTNDPANAKVVYYNRADPTPEDEPHTPENPGTDIPGFVPPASKSGGTDTPGSAGSLAGSATQGTAGTTTPQAHVSGSSADTKGFLPQTGEWIAQNWVLLLGLVMLLSAIGLMVRSKRKKG